MFRYQAQSSLGCVSFSPWEAGYYILAASADGNAFILNLDGDEKPIVHKAHDSSVNGVSWAVVTPRQDNKARFVTAGSDGRVKIWRVV